MSRIQHLRYTPHFLALNTHLQGIIYAFYKTLSERFSTLNYQREIFTCRDGGRLALEWHTSKPSLHDERPLLICVGGLGSGT